MKLNRNIKKYFIYLLICVAPFTLMGADCGIADDPSYYQLKIYSTGTGNFSGYYIKNTDTTFFAGVDNSPYGYLFEVDLGTFESLQVNVTGTVDTTTSIQAYLYENDVKMVDEYDSVSQSGDVATISFYYEPGTEETTE